MPAMAAGPRWILGSFKSLKNPASPTPMATTSPMTRLMSFPVIPSSDQTPGACRMWRVHPAHAHVRAVEHSSDYHGCATYMTRISAVGQPAQSHHRRGNKRPRARSLHRAEVTALPPPSRPDDPASPANAPLHQHLPLYSTAPIPH